MVEDQKDLMALLKWTAEQNATIRGDYCGSACRNCCREFKDFDYENSANGCSSKDLIEWLRDIGIDEHSIKIVSFYKSKYMIKIWTSGVVEIRRFVILSVCPTMS